MRWEADVGAKKWYREEGEKQNGHRNSKICANQKGEIALLATAMLNYLERRRRS
jgi:hypothetical protein